MVCRCVRAGDRKLPTYLLSLTLQVQQVCYRFILADCLQAELVDGFLAWDFDADTAATFFVQQVYRHRRSIYPFLSLLSNISVNYSRHYLASSRSRARVSTSSWPPADDAVGSRGLGDVGRYPYAPAGTHLILKRKQIVCANQYGTWTLVVTSDEQIITHLP